MSMDGDGVNCGPPKLILNQWYLYVTPHNILLYSEFSISGCNLVTEFIARVPRSDKIRSLFSWVLKRVVSTVQLNESLWSKCLPLGTRPHDVASHYYNINRVFIINHCYNGWYQNRMFGWFFYTSLILFKSIKANFISIKSLCCWLSIVYKRIMGAWLKWVCNCISNIIIAII